MLRKLWSPVLGFVVCLSMTGTRVQAQATAQGDKKEPVVLDEIVAKVNNEIITLSDLRRTLRQLRIELQDEFDNPEELEKAFEERKRGVLALMIQNKVMVQKAEELGMTSDIDVDVAAYLEQLRKDAGIPSLDVLDQYFRQRGSSLAEYKQRVREQMIARNLLQQFVYAKITLLTPEIEAYYREHAAEFTEPARVHLAEILLLKEGRNAQAQRAKAEAALRRLEAGEAFEEVAKEVSEGPTASRGGDIGEFTKGSMNPALEEVAFSIPVSSHSGIIETDYGFQIIKVVSREEPRLKPLEEVRPIIAQRLYERKAEPEVKEYLKKLFSESYIYVAPKYREEYDVEELFAS
ncbi:MAG: peptidylprolyl isomerase [Acidobacteriota bacterium]